VQSVQQQTFPRIEHLIVVDGIEARQKSLDVIQSAGPLPRKVYVVPLPFPTGKSGWCGHRIYGAYSFLCNTEFVSYLDEDNWFELDHVESLVTEIRRTNAAWGFSLRRIFDAEGNFVVLDQCESLGTLHPTFRSDDERLIDTNCFLMRRETAVVAAPGWYNPIPPAGLGADRIVTKFLFTTAPNSCCTRRHTLNYTAGRSPQSVQPSFFVKGNAKMHARYPDGLPWEKR
jgi:hypothetical protein